MNKRETQYVIKKKIGGKKPKDINIASILKVVETQHKSQYQYLTVSIMSTKTNLITMFKFFH